MSLSKWFEVRTKKLHWYDWWMVKWSAVVFGLFIAKIWPPILILDWYWYLIISLVLGFIPGYKYFFVK